MNGDTEIKVKPVGERSCVLKSVKSSAASLELPTYCDGRYITEIGRGAFKKCPALKILTIPESVTRIGAKAFSGSDIERIVIPKTVEFIGKNAFHNCVHLSSVVIENSSATVQPHIFSGCYHISHAVVPVTAVERGWLDHIEEITVTGEGIISARLFSDCKHLKKVVIGEGITDIYERAFSGCDRLAEVSLPDSLYSIEDFSFYGSALETLTVPRSVQEIEVDAFGGSKLKELIVADGNPVYHSKGNCIIETATKKLVAGCANSFIPSDGSVTVIGEDAFYDCKELTGLEIPDGIIEIQDSAFSGCSSLVSIVLPEGIETIGDFVFDGCKELESVVLPASLRKLGFSVLDDCEWLEYIVYNGTTEQWACIEKDNSWNFTEIKVHCKDGDVEL